MNIRLSFVPVGLMMSAGLLNLVMSIFVISATESRNIGFAQLTVGAVLLALGLVYWRIPYLAITRDALIFPYRPWQFRVDIPEGATLKVIYPHLYLTDSEGHSERVPVRLSSTLHRGDLAELRARYGREKPSTMSSDSRKAGRLAARLPCGDTEGSTGRQPGRNGCVPSSPRVSRSVSSCARNSVIALVPTC